LVCLEHYTSDKGDSVPHRSVGPPPCLATEPASDAAFRLSHCRGGNIRDALVTRKPARPLPRGCGRHLRGLGFGQGIRANRLHPAHHRLPMGRGIGGHTFGSSRSNCALAEGHLQRRLLGGMLRRIWALPMPWGWHSDYGYKIWCRGKRIGAVSENSIPGQQAGLVTRAKTSRRTPLISVGAALGASSLCIGQEQRKMRESEVQIGNSFLHDYLPLSCK
jgi:hypothetical protein